MIVASWLLLAAGSLFAQSEEYLTGTVSAIEQGEEVPLNSASVRWLGLDIGVYTDESGTFRIRKSPSASQLIVSYAGYTPDTVKVSDQTSVKVVFTEAMTLEGVDITRRNQSTRISFIDPLKTENIDERELLKAACCNLSESFETSPSVDVSFTDAITGTRQIQMLGLDGPYTQITRENMPSVRGMNSMYGLTFTPGTWVKGMQLNKGTGTVVNGFESIAGQINVELRKPQDAERMYLNLYGNQMGRIEANANFAHRFKDSPWSTAFLLHAKSNSIRNDVNEDGFMDNPLSNQFIGLNRWQYIGDNGLMSQFGIKSTTLRNVAGQMEFDPLTDLGSDNIWGMKVDIDRLEGWAKLGKVWLDIPWRSFGLQVSGATHRQASIFGQNEYFGAQRSLYANFIYQDILANTNHTFKTGTSFMMDEYEESLNGTDYDRMEMVPGAFFEYTYTHLESFSLVAGIRGDYHNLFGFFVTPRLHLRYAVTPKTVVRASVGQGRRTANILAENNGLLASSREIVILGEQGNTPYGLDQEVAMNAGINVTQYLTIGEREGSITLDLYRTQFQNQIVVDRDDSPQQLVFYNLDGESFANSLQVQLDYELIPRLDLRVAYRWFDIQTTYSGELLSKPLISTHRAFTNLAYQTGNGWSFDLTANWQGSKRLPGTLSNPEAFQLSERSPDFLTVNAQVSKNWGAFEVYVGGENLFNARQDNPILAPESPFNDYFDATMVWGPIFGRNIYAGLRYRVE